MTMASLILVAALSQSPHAEPQGVIRGRVILAGTGEPVAGVAVDVSARIHGQRWERSARSGADGTFRIERLPAGEYLLDARKTGYLAATAFPLPVSLAATDGRVDVTLRFRRQAVVSGVLTDAEGQPIVGARVTARQYVWFEGRRYLQAVADAGTDDRGFYRIFSLPAGTYLVAAAVGPPPGGPDGDLEMPAVTYYPSALSATEATPIPLPWGGERTDVNLKLRPQPAYSISGVLTDARTGGPCRSCTIRITRLDDASGFSLSGYGTRPDGGYRALGLPPGTYRVIAETAAPEGGHLVSARTVTIVDRNLRDVNLLAGLERTLRGRVVLENPPAGQEIRPQMFLYDGRSAVTPHPRVLPDLTFEVRGLGPLLYRVAAVAPPGYLKTLRFDGRDLPSPEVQIPEQGPPGPVEAVIAFDGATVEGVVRPPESAGRGHRVTAAQVALYPQENQSAYLTPKKGFTDGAGNFTLAGVAPGSYTAFAIPAGTCPDFDDPEVRRGYAAYGRPVDLPPGQVVKMELILAPEAEPGP